VGYKIDQKTDLIWQNQNDFQIKDFMFDLLKRFFSNFSSYPQKLYN